MNALKRGTRSLTGPGNGRPDSSNGGRLPVESGLPFRTVGTYGNVGRNALRGPNMVNVDVALSRIFGVTERFRLEARAEAFNGINQSELRPFDLPNDGTPADSVRSPRDPQDSDPASIFPDRGAG